MKIKSCKFLILFLLNFSFTLCGSKIEHEKYSLSVFRPNIDHALNSNKFSINHGFSISTSINDSKSQSFAIYSNQTQYKLSENLQIKTKFNLIQNQNIYSSTMPQANIQYGLGLEYKFNQNSIFTFQILKQNNSFFNKNYIFP
jgi:hypothetical protein